MSSLVLPCVQSNDCLLQTVKALIGLFDLLNQSVEWYMGWMVHTSVGKTSSRIFIIPLVSCLYFLHHLHTGVPEENNFLHGLCHFWGWTFWREKYIFIIPLVSCLCFIHYLHTGGHEENNFLLCLCHLWGFSFWREIGINTSLEETHI